MSAEPISVGNELKDSFKETHNWVQNNIKWLRDVERYYRERSKLEREYSEKLGHLTNEFFNKKSTTSVSISVGDAPASTPGSIEAASLVAWNEVLAQTELIAKDHAKLSQDFEGHIASQIAGLFSKMDMTMTKIEGFHKEMSDRKTQAYQDLDKAKKDYDEACSVMEIARNKNTKSPGDRTKKKLIEKEHEMNITKNDYLVKINQANRIKDKFYFQDEPESLDLLQDLNETKTAFMNEIWKQAAQYETNTGSIIKKRLETADGVITQNKPSLNTAIFIKHNIKQWKEPADFQYIPSSVWHDDEKFVVTSEIEANDLRLKLAQAEKEYHHNHDYSQNEMSQLSKFNERKKELKTNEDSITGQEYYDILKNYINVVSSFTSHETAKLKAEVAIESIQNNTPDEYDLSTDNVDLSKLKKKSGFFSKIKLNLSLGDSMPLNNIQPKSHINVFGGLTHNRKSSGTSIGGATTSSEPDRDDIFDDSAPSSTTNTPSNGNKVLYAYSKQDEDEVSVNLGDSIKLVTPDTGSGWTKVINTTTGETGLVPTTYIEIKEKSDKRGPPPAAPPSRRANVAVRTMEAIYDYTAQGDDELSIAKNDVMTVLKGDDGSGWTYCELDGQKGLVPTSYCK